MVAECIDLGGIQMNLWHDIKPNRMSTEDFLAVIEIEKGSKNKYEMDKETRMLRLDRILYTSTHYPANYGFIPRTYADDRDPLDVLVLCSQVLDPLVEVECFPLGCIRMMDGGDYDDKIIAVPCFDPTYNSYTELAQLPPHIITEVSNFFEIYKMLENKTTATNDVLDAAGARDIIQRAMDSYDIHYCGKYED